MACSLRLWLTPVTLSRVPQMTDVGTRSNGSRWVQWSRLAKAGKKSATTLNGVLSSMSWVKSTYDAGTSLPNA